MTRSIQKLSAVLMSLIAIAASFGQVASQNVSIINSKHNLSASGPGSIRASDETEICIFCHTPHNSSPIVPMWNRNLPLSAYTVYHSSSLDALPGQPTGSSKLCLSCHDGTIAVGNVLSRDQNIVMTGANSGIPDGTSNLGTDLSDDHPISFRYDAGLSGRDVKLKNPATLPPTIKLDRQGEMQCTTCHDPHNNANGSFLVTPNTNSQLCNSCHAAGQTSIAAHQECSSCHNMHAAPSGSQLLRAETTLATCSNCHSGQTGPNQGPDIASELVKLSRHDTDPPIEPKTHSPTEITCADCHESHTMNSGSMPGAPTISPKLGRVSGVNTVGASVTVAQFQYEVCFKCHTESSPSRAIVSRVIEQTNTRLEFSPTAVSFHPIEAAGKNTFVPSLKPGLSTASMIYCTDCHASDSTANSGASNGPHGSNNVPLLVLPYDITDGAAESENAYALCYKCHDRTSILSNASFTSHSKHVVDQRTPCSVCHDSHGVSSVQGTATNNSRLINFDTRVVQPDPISGRLEFRTSGPGSGECYLSCHGVDHSPLAYPGGVTVPVLPPSDPPLPPPGPLNAQKGGLRHNHTNRLLPPAPSIRDRNRMP